MDTETSFQTFLKRAQEQGNLNKLHTVQETARFLLSIRNGILVLGKSATDRKVLEDAAKVAMTIIV
ncbi:hypothetical protein D3C85_1891810 [compost metagenome]